MVLKFGFAILADHGEDHLAAGDDGRDSAFAVLCQSRIFPSQVAACLRDFAVDEEIFEIGMVAGDAVVVAV